MDAFSLHFVLSRYRTCLVDVEDEIFGDEQIVDCVGHGDFSLSHPRVDIEIVVALLFVLVFHDGAFFHLWNRELEEFMSLVNPLTRDAVVLHLRLHHLAVLHVVSPCFQTSDILVQRPVLIVVDIENFHIGIFFSFGLENLDASLYFGRNSKTSCHDIIPCTCALVEDDGRCRLVGCIGCHGEFLIRRIPEFFIDGLSHEDWRINHAHNE